MQCWDGRCIILVDRLLNLLIGAMNLYAHFGIQSSPSQLSVTKLTDTHYREQMLYLNLYVYLN